MARPSILAVPAAALRQYRGRRARRAAFYQRRRTARHLSALASRLSTESQSAFEQAMRDVLLRGVGWYEVRRSAPAATLPPT